VRAVGADEPDLVARTRARIRAYLEALAAEPAFARTFLIEVRAAGPEALERQRAVHEQFAALGRELAEAAGLPEVSHDIHLAAVGATSELVSAWIHDGRTHELPQLEDTLLRIQVALIARQAG
jgi:AcrR family transcriptional regulator